METCKMELEMETCKMEMEMETCKMEMETCKMKTFIFILESFSLTLLNLSTLTLPPHTHTPGIGARDETARAGGEESGLESGV